MVFKRLLLCRQISQIRYYCESKEWGGLKSDKVSINSFFCSKNAIKPKNQITEDCLESFSKIGDNGTSKTINGDVLPKDHEIFHAIGAAEELLSYLG